MNEQNIIGDLQQAALALGLPAAHDIRADLVRHETHRWRGRKVEAIKGLVWHQELSWGSVEDVHAFHTGPNSSLQAGGVESFPYTWGIRRNGQLVLCNNFAAKPWSQGDRDRAGDENAEFMSVMFEGHFDGTGHTAPDSAEPTQEQMMAALILWRVCAKEAGWDQDDLYGHYHFGKPACPGHTGQAVIEAFRKCPSVDAPIPPSMTHNLASVEGRQGALIDLGYLVNSTADGNWGPLSKGALIKFQAANSLLVDGVWGARTQRAILNVLEKEE